MLGLPKDFIRTLRPRLASVTPAQLRAAAKQYMRADRTLIVVVGDGAQIYERLARIAPTRIINAQGEAMTPADLVTKAAALPVDVSKLVERADSFSVLVQGNPLGFQKASLTRTPQGFVYRSSMALGPIMSQSVESIFGADLKPISTKGAGKVQGQNLVVDVSYANGRVKGSAATPGPGGTKTVSIDTIAAPGVLDDNMITAIVPGLPWSPAAKFNVTVLDASSGTFNNLTLAVTGTESVTVPAGTFATYRVELTGQQQPLTLYVTTAGPHRLVKMRMTGTPLEFVLAK